MKFHIMSEWKTYKLGELATIKGGKRLPKGVLLQSTPNSHPYIRIRDLGKTRILELDSTYEYVDDLTQKSIARYIVEKGDILLSIVGTIGLVGIVGESLHLANQTENCVKLINLNKVDRLYLYYYLSSKIGQIEIHKGIVGAVQAKLPIKNIENIEISLPPLAEQKRIADILSAIDDKIELNRRINANLEQQAQALYKSWFVDFEPFGGKMPEDWRVGTLGEICITNKRSYSGKFYNSFEYLDTGSVTSNKIDTIQLLNPTIDKIPSRARRAVTEGDILYSSVRPNQKHYMFLYNPSSNMVVSTGFIVITANWSGYRYYIYQYLIQDIVIQHLQSIAEQSVSTYPSINASDITNLEINIPSNKAIEKYANVMNPIMKQITNNQSENLRLAQLRDTLLPKLMSGEIKV